jgi:CheY-like chemotaxis protein
MEKTFKILVAEDDLNLNWVYQSILEDAGYQTITAPGGTEALALVQQTSPDLLVTDVRLPGLDGFELAQAIRGNPVTIGMPIIFISGAAEPGERERAARLGIHRYLSKPAQVTELLSAVRTALALL